MDGRSPEDKDIAGRGNVYKDTQPMVSLGIASDAVIRAQVCY